MGQPCERDELPDPMCPTTQWSDWSPCSASCGKGIKLRTRLLLVEPGLQEKCNSRIEMVQQRPCSDKIDCTFDMATAKRTSYYNFSMILNNRYYLIILQRCAWRKLLPVHVQVISRGGHSKLTN